MDLTDWIAPRLFLGEEAVKPLPGPEAAPRLFVIDDFLTPFAVEGLLGLFADPDAWEDSYGLFGPGAPERVSREEWLAAPDRRRFWFYGERKPRAPGSFDTAQAHLVMCRERIFPHPDLIARLSAGTGLDIQGGGFHLVPITFRTGQYQAPHSDAGRGRLLCGALYLSSGWQPGFGGEFEMMMGAETLHVVQPRANRIILFNPKERHALHPEIQPRHRIRPMTQAAAGWRRCSISVWWQARVPVT